MSRRPQPWEKILRNCENSPRRPAVDGEGFRFAQLALLASSNRVVNTLVRLFEYCGAKASRNGVSITIKADETAVREIARSVVGCPEIDPVALALGVDNKETNKFDPYLSEELLARDYAVREFDVPGAVGVLKGYLV